MCCAFTLQVYKERVDRSPGCTQKATVYNVYGMVEGGASVLSAFMQSHLMDCLCITIAPILIGNEQGLAAFENVNFVGGCRDGTRKCMEG